MCKEHHCASAELAHTTFTSTVCAAFATWPVGQTVTIDDSAKSHQAKAVKAVKEVALASILGSGLYTMSFVVVSRSIGAFFC